MTSNKIKNESSISEIFLNWSCELIPTEAYSCYFKEEKNFWKSGSNPLINKKEKKKRIIIDTLIKGGTATIKPITKYYLGWWEGLVPTGTYSCFLVKEGLKSWRLDNYPLNK